MVVLSTGLGKTVLLSQVIKDHQGLSCVMAHRQELVSQLSMSLARFEVMHRIIAPKNVIASIVREHQIEFGRTYYNANAPAAVAGVNTLVARQDALSRWAQQVTLWVGDEIHHYLKKNLFGAAASMFPHARGLGVTATPQRADGKGLGAHSDGLFHVMLEGPPMSAAMQMGNLCRYRIVAPPGDFDADHIKITASGDFSGKEMREAARKSHIVGDVVEHYLRFAAGKTGITFATDVETANEIAEQYRQAGVPCQAVSAETPEHVRNDFVRRFKRGDLKQLVNVDLFGEGFDLPNLEVVSMARPTMSLAVYLQQVGRGLRPSPGKDRALIIDHVGNVKRHGLPDIPRRWTLDAREKRSSKAADPDVIPLTTCLSCYEVYERVKAVCPHCGYKHQPDARRRPDQVDGDLAMLDDDVLDALRQAAIQAMETPESMADRVGFVAGPIAGKGAANRQREKIEAQENLRHAIALWAGQQRSLNRPDEESYRRFFLTFGIDVLSAQALGRNEAEKLTVDIQKALG
jgi:superfamily II DNA or RNA helicase